MKKGIIIGGILVLLIVLIAIFNNNNSNNNLNTEEIRIGVILPLTGPLAEYGDAIQNGILLAQKEYPNNNLDFIFEDNAYDPSKALSAFNKLTKTDNVQLILNFGDPTSDALASSLRDNEVPFVGLTTAVTSFIETTDYSLRAYNRPEEFAEVMWKYLRSKNMKNIAIIKVENTYINGLVDALINTKMSDESVTIVDNYLSLGDKDFRTSITKIKNSSSEYDALGIYLMSGQIGQFYRQSQTLGLSVPTFGTDFFEGQNDIDVAGNSINGAVFSNYLVSDDFKEKYEEEFGSISQISFAGNAYDLASMLNNLKSGDKKSIMDLFKSIKNFKGVMGSYEYRDTEGDRYLYSPIHLKTIQNQEIMVL